MAKAVKTALVMNLGICITKLVAAVITRSAGMMAEAVHSFADTGNQALLLLGMKMSKKKPDENHPFGHGKNEYLCSFVVALLLFVLGSLYSIYEGVHKILSPEPLHNIPVALVVLGAGVLMEGYSWLVARKELDCTTSELFEEVMESKDSNTIVVFVEDTAALIGLAVAFLGTVASWITCDPLYDAISSIVIGVLLGIMAAFLGSETKSLNVGEAIEEREVRFVRFIINTHPDVLKCGEIKTEQKGNNHCIICADVDFRDDLMDGQLDVIIQDLHKRIRRTLPDAHDIYLQPKKL